MTRTLTTLLAGLLVAGIACAQGADKAPAAKPTDGKPATASSEKSTANGEAKGQTKAPAADAAQRSAPKAADKPVATTGAKLAAPAAPAAPAASAAGKVIK